MKHRRDSRTRKSHRCSNSAMGGVFHKLGKAFGVSHGATIAVFVVGWIFVPLLTTLVFLAALYWVYHPEQAERQARQLAAWVSRAARQFSEGVIPQPGPRVSEPDFAQPPDAEQPEPNPRQPRSASELRRRFEALERRAKSIESFVASEEFRLEGEFKRMDEGPG